ncbi:MAG: Sulfate/thiosulfate import ATP-binding protein CysA [Actinobacteria bacterium]|nr:Sulfate/thiosulfate import ATP-binding protein CysA [Actinomycetota bacterium]
MIDLTIKKKVGDFCLDVDLQVENEILVLFGPSGAGKSTILQCVAGLLTPDEGLIAIDGEKVFAATAGRMERNVPVHRRRIGYVFQNYALFPHLTVWQNIVYGVRRHPQRREMVEDMIIRMRLGGLEKRYSHQLSGGQQQRVALARALVIQPRVLLLDEPFAALDTMVREKLQQDLLHMQGQLGLSTLYVTHDVKDAFTLGDRLAIINKGKIEQIGSKEDVFDHPTSIAAARFTGTRNIFRGEVMGRDENGVVILWRGFKLWSSCAAAGTGSKVEFCIRPEEIMIMRDDRPPKEELAQNLLSGKIVRQIAKGPSISLFLKIEESDGTSGEAKLARDYDLEMALPRHVYRKLDLRIGKRVTVSLKRSALYVIGPLA